MKNYIFTCKDCVHVTKENDIQTGCNLNKLQSFIDQEKASINPATNFYDLNRVCMSKNNVDQRNTKVGYLFILKNKDKLPELINNISLCLKNNPIWIGVVHDFPELKDEIVDNVKHVPCLHNIICNFSTVDNLYIPDQLINKYKNGWTIINVVGEKFDETLYNTLDEYIISNKKPVALIKNLDNSMNGMVFFNIIYKFLKGSKPDIDEETQDVTFRTYEHKIIEMSPDMIKTWEDLNENNRIISN